MNAFAQDNGDCPRSLPQDEGSKREDSLYLSGCRVRLRPSRKLSESLAH